MVKGNGEVTADLNRALAAKSSCLYKAGERVEFRTQRALRAREASVKAWDRKK